MSEDTLTENVIKGFCVTCSMAVAFIVSSVDVGDWPDRSIPISTKINHANGDNSSDIEQTQRFMVYEQAQINTTNTSNTQIIIIEPKSTPNLTKKG